MNSESWYAKKLSDMDVIRISESDDWIVDYDRGRGMYRVSYFEYNHFRDEHWFDAYEEKELDMSFPQTIGDITYYNKAELFEWIENQQQNNEKSLSEALEKYELVQCKMTDEEFKEVLDKFCELPLTNPILSNELKKILDKNKENT